MKTYLIAGIVLFAGLVLLSSAVGARPYKTNTYSFDMPGGCKTESKENKFSTGDGITVDCRGNADFYFEISDTTTSEVSGTDEEQPDQMLGILDDRWQKVNEVERGTDKYIINNQTAPYVIATYAQTFNNFLGLPNGNEEEWVLMMVAVKAGNDTLLVQHRNDESHFERFLPTFEKMLASIQAQGLPNEPVDTLEQ